MEFAPYSLEENFGGYFDYLDDYELAEELQNQECVLQSFHRSAPSNTARSTSSSSVSGLNNGHARSLGERGSSRTVRSDAQLDVDEVLAREMQEMEFRDQPTNNNTELDTNSVQSYGSNSEPSSSSVSPQAEWRSDVNPDNMTYEELQELGESVGTESRGLSDELISYLPSSTYKTGLFSLKDKIEECVICCQTYKNRDKLIDLPCKHRYHKNCIVKWLKINKTCPICTKEVFGST